MYTKNEEEKIFTEQIELIKESISLLGLRKNIFESLAKEHDHKDVHEEEIQVIISLFAVRSIDLYNRVLSFISEEISSGDEWRHYFSIPHVRTLDIHSRFIHLQEYCFSDEERAKNCLGLQMMTYAQVDDYIYQGGLDLFKNFIGKTGLHFPAEHQNLNYTWLNKNNIAFRTQKELLTVENIKKYAGYSLDVFKPERTYKIYSYFSNLIHGNPYYSEDVCRERFWIISVSISTTTFLIELIDKFFLNKINPKDFRILLKKIETANKSFLGLWHAKRQGIL